MPILQDKDIILGFPITECDFELFDCPDPSSQEYLDRSRALRELIWLIFRYGSEFRPDGNKSEESTGMYYLYSEVFRHLITTQLSDNGHFVPTNASGDPVFQLSSISTGDLIINTNGTRNPAFTSVTYLTHMETWLPKLNSPLIDSETLKTIRPTILCEAATIFAYYYLNFVLSNYSGVKIDITSVNKDNIYRSSGSTADGLNENVLTGHPLYKYKFNHNKPEEKHPLIKCLKNQLVKLGFRADKMDDPRFLLMVHQTFNPVRPVGVSFPMTPFDEFPKFKTSDYIDIGHPEKPFILLNQMEEDKNRLYYFISMLRLGFPSATERSHGIITIGDDEKPPIVTEGYVSSTITHDPRKKTGEELMSLYLKAQEFSEAYAQAFSKYIQHLIICFYQSLDSELSVPPSAILASGDGSGTKGILNITNAAVATFSYQFTNDRLSKVSPEQIQTFTVNTEDDVIHFNSLGFDFINDSEFTIENLSTHEVVAFKANKSTGTFIPKNSSTTVFEQDPIDPNVYYFYASGSTPEGKKLIGTYYKNFHDFKYNNVGAIEVEIRLKSAKEPFAPLHGEFEELQVLFNIVPVPDDHSLTLSFDDLYSNDKFEATKEKITSILNTEKERKFIRRIINSIINEPTLVINPFLQGNFVGITQDELPDQPRIKSDINYIPDDDTISEENNPVSDVAYSKLRYSYGRISYVSNTEVNIFLNSWVSPRVSNLDQKIVSEDYRNGSLIPPGAPTSFPLGSSAVTLTALNNNFVNQNYIIPAFSKYSYNQPLAMLRSFGLLEAFFLKVKYVASEMLSNGDITVANFATVKSKLGSVLNTSVCMDKSRESRNIIAPSPDWQLSSILTFNDFTNFKWYRYESIRYDDLNNAVRVGGNYVIISGHYEYDEFDHESW